MAHRMEGLGQIVAGWCYERSASVIQMCSRCGRPKTKAEATFFGAQQPLLDTPVLLYPTISIPITLSPPVQTVSCHFNWYCLGHLLCSLMVSAGLLVHPAGHHHL